MSALSPVEVYEARLKFIPNFIIDVINKILIKRCKSPTGAIEILDYELQISVASLSNKTCRCSPVRMSLTVAAPASSSCDPTITT